MGWSNPGEITVTKLVVSGTNEGIFVYNGTPAAGNLILSITSTPGTDAFGNVYYSGLGLGVTAAAGNDFLQWVNQILPSDPVTAPTISTQLNAVTNHLAALEFDGPTIVDGVGNFCGTYIKMGTNEGISKRGEITLAAGDTGKQINLNMLGVGILAGPLGGYYVEQFSGSAPQASGTLSTFSNYNNWNNAAAHSYSDYGVQMSGGIWTCPETGFYDLDCELVFSRLSVAATLAAKLRDNTAAVDVLGTEMVPGTAGPATFHLSLDGIVFLTKGHTYNIQTTTSSSSATSFSSASTLTFARRL